MIGPGLPGAGNILIFDNGVEEAHNRSSIVLELNPVSLELEWLYEHEDFFSGFRSTVERLPNGNTFINEADHKRMLEVTADCEIVWEYWVPELWRAGRSHRVPYDFGSKRQSIHHYNQNESCLCTELTIPIETVFPREFRKM